MLSKEDRALGALAKQLNWLVLQHALDKVALRTQDLLVPVELCWLLIEVDFSYASALCDNLDEPLLVAVGTFCFYGSFEALKFV